MPPCTMQDAVKQPFSFRWNHPTEYFFIYYATVYFIEHRTYFKYSKDKGKIDPDVWKLGTCQTSTWYFPNLQTQRKHVWWFGAIVFFPQLLTLSLK